VNPYNFRSAAYGAARYLAQFKSRGVRGMLAAYNAGPAGNPNNPETAAYVPKVLALAASWPGPSGGSSGAGGGAGGATAPKTQIGTAGKGAESLGGGSRIFGKAAGVRLPRKQWYDNRQIGFDIAEAKAEGTEGTQDDLMVVVARAAAIGTRLRQINAALKRGGLSHAQRRRLRQEKAQLLSERNSLNTRAKEIVSPDDLPTATDFLDAQVAEAALTPGTEDDKAAAAGVVGYWETELATARASGDPRKITEAATNLKAAREALESIDETQKFLLDTQTRLADTLAGLQAELKRQNDFGEHVLAISSREALRFSADLISGEVSGQLQGRRMTAGTGSGVLIP
jgi:hypothetical protein